MRRPGTISHKWLFRQILNWIFKELKAFPETREPLAGRCFSLKFKEEGSQFPCNPPSPAINPTFSKFLKKPLT
jgi:hypothetical protein